ncbi:MAG: putative tributyrin esterase [Acidimicrobiaceae bacterium]|jgi:S-formylglutathione hydrolase FrmB|nr:putative tributyrin esterase [Acidimicrobiaceae bacterium]
MVPVVSGPGRVPAPGRLVGETVWSEANRRRFEHWAWVPEGMGEGPFPLLLLLHGVYDAGGFVWWHKGSARETLDRLGLPVVVLMATDTGAEQGSGYCDWVDGTTRAESHVIDELLQWASWMLPVQGATRHIAGLSMGGYGSLLLALRHPGVFESASSTSGFFSPSRLFDFVPDAATRMWGDEEGQAAHDVRGLIADRTRREGLRIAFDCGTEDVLLDDNRLMHSRLDELGVEHGYAEHAGGHDWDYWTARLADHVCFALGHDTPLAPAASASRGRDLGLAR